MQQQGQGIKAVASEKLYENIPGSTTKHAQALCVAHRRLILTSKGAIVVGIFKF